MDPQMDFNTMLFGKLENKVQDDFSQEEVEFNQQLKLGSKGNPKIPMSYYFSQGQQGLSGQQGPFQKPLSKFEGGDYDEINYNPLGAMKNLNMSNINNMNINIINHIPMKNPNPQINYMMNNESEELINNFSNLNIQGGIPNNNKMMNVNVNNPPKKDMAYNYYFGAQGGKHLNQNISSIPTNPMSNSNQEENFGYYDQEEEQIDPRLLQNQNQNFYYKQKNYPNMNNMSNLNMNPNMMNRMNFGQNSQTPQFYNNNNSYKNYNQNKMNQNNYHHDKNKFNNQNKKNYQGGNKYNNMQMNMQVNNVNTSETNFIPGRYFVIKSLDEDNIHKSIKYRIWCSTIKGNQKLQKAFKEADNKYPIYLFFSVNGSGRFLGLAQMTSEVEYRANFNYWTQNEKWKGFFFLVWLAIKDIPNRVFRNILNEYNENKPVTASRDTQEIHPFAGAEMLKIFSEYPYETSILDDFKFYEQKQETLVDYKQKGMNTNVQHNLNTMNSFKNMTNNMGFPNDNEEILPGAESELNINPMSTVSNLNNNLYDDNFKNFLIQQQSFKQSQQLLNPPKRIIKRINSTENILKGKEANSDSEGENN